MATAVGGGTVTKTRIVRTAEVTIETEESIVLHGSKRQRSGSLWCPVCRREAEMVTAEQAAQLAGVSRRTIYFWGESGKAHFLWTPERIPLVCLASIQGTDSMPG